jgi:hypothetical protein
VGDRENMSEDFEIFILKISSRLIQHNLHTGPATTKTDAAYEAVRDMQRLDYGRTICIEEPEDEGWLHPDEFDIICDDCEERMPDERDYGPPY